MSADHRLPPRHHQRRVGPALRTLAHLPPPFRISPFPFLPRKNPNLQHVSHPRTSMFVVSKSAAVPSQKGGARRTKEFQCHRMPSFLSKVCQGTRSTLVIITQYL